MDKMKSETQLNTVYKRSTLSMKIKQVEGEWMECIHHEERKDKKLK